MNSNIYTFGVSKDSQVIIRAANDLLRMISPSPDSWKIIDTTPVISRFTITGQLLKRLHLHKLSKVFFYLGAKREIDRLSKRWQQFQA